MMEERDLQQINTEHVCYQSTNNQQQEGKKRPIRCDHGLVFSIIRNIEENFVEEEKLQLA